MPSSVLLILIRTVNREYLRRNGRRNGPARDRVSWVKNNRVIRVVVRCKRLSGNCGQEWQNTRLHDNNPTATAQLRQLRTTE